MLHFRRSLQYTIRLKQIAEIQRTKQKLLLDNYKYQIKCTTHTETQTQAHFSLPVLIPTHPHVMRSSTWPWDAEQPIRSFEFWPVGLQGQKTWAPWPYLVSTSTTWLRPRLLPLATPQRSNLSWCISGSAMWRLAARGQHTHTHTHTNSMHIIIYSGPSIV